MHQTLSHRRGIHSKLFWGKVLPKRASLSAVRVKIILNKHFPLPAHLLKIPKKSMRCCSLRSYLFLHEFLGYLLSPPPVQGFKGVLFSFYQVMKSFKFYDHLFALSSQKTEDEALSEWVKVFEKVQIVTNGVCICQRGIKNVVFMYNVITQHTIMVGTDCYKKFCKERSEMRKGVVEETLKRLLMKGSYTLIEDIVRYSMDVKVGILDIICGRISGFTANRDFESLQDLREEIHDLKEKYRWEWLDKPLDDIETFFDEDEKQRKAEQRKEEARLAQISASARIEAKARNEAEARKQAEAEAYREANLAHLLAKAEIKAEEAEAAQRKTKEAIARLWPSKEIRKVGVHATEEARLLQYRNKAGAALLKNWLGGA